MKVEFFAEEEGNGFSASAQHPRGCAFATGDNMEDLKVNMLSSINTLMEDLQEPALTQEQLEFVPREK